MHGQQKVKKKLNDNEYRNNWSNNDLIWKYVLNNWLFWIQTLQHSQVPSPSCMLLSLSYLSLWLNFHPSVWSNSSQAGRIFIKFS